MVGSAPDLLYGRMYTYHLDQSLYAQYAPYARDTTASGGVFCPFRASLWAVVGHVTKLALLLCSYNEAKTYSLARETAPLKSTGTFKKLTTWTQAAYQRP